ncbi:hypothetical protein JI721_14080 [Alicyclobacillus cycloheptanicus]|uniref:Uncharacterized protein n=1 Tax=Alicyclobacillus cycloheptanicus TaxID=1457 RepID=A0ABT9XLZ2_9BACL|nr:hypothetical protein [Alicyclobacillus cycloheptanicus]MDQ0191333.1 hypothetical protein [Alicyclobacillus cycloheptanicus]WDM00806.1 hypothetical protein JI721_14080 [Alicyclobacillus cycloheptanicus]
MTKRTLLFAGIIVGQIAYFFALHDVWKVVGWQSNLSHGLGWFTAILAWAVNPCICAFVASKITWNAGKAATVNVCILFFSILLACLLANASIWFNASGYGTHIQTLPFAAETLAWRQFATIVEMVISGILFIVGYSVLLTRHRESAPANSYSGRRQSNEEV